MDSKNASKKGVVLWKKIRHYILERLLAGMLIGVPLFMFSCIGYVAYDFLFTYWDQIVMHGKKVLTYSGIALAVLFGLGHLSLKFFNSTPNLDSSIDDPNQ
jgi:hypothetical protein